MELPKPDESETREDFTSRCMKDEIMNKEYPNQDKRNDVSNGLWYGKKTTELSKQLEDMSN